MAIDANLNLVVALSTDAFLSLTGPRLAHSEPETPVVDPPPVTEPPETRPEPPPAAPKPDTKPGKAPKPCRGPCRF